MNQRMNVSPVSVALLAAFTLMSAGPLLADQAGRTGAQTGASSTSAGMTSQTGSQEDKFGWADSNKDGKLSQSEYQALQQHIGQKAAAAPSPGLMQKRVKDVVGMDVVNQGGTKIGKVSDLVANRQDSSLHAVVSVGGFLGIGDTEISMPLNQMAWSEDQLVAPTAATKKQLKTMPEYNTAAYRKLDGNQLIADLSGKSGDHGSIASFETLDSNNDQRIDSLRVQRL
jgi:hypothetical protein